MQRRPHDSMMIAAFWFSAYAINHDMVRFPDSPAVPETLIETTGQDISHVAQSILVHVCAR
jgi:hypothetical protein